MSRTTSVARQIEKIERFASLYGYKSKTARPKTVQQLANERWHTAEHIKANSLPTVVGETYDSLTHEGETDIYAMLTEFFFNEHMIWRNGEAQFFPTYAVLPNGQVIPYDLRNPGADDEELLVWI